MILLLILTCVLETASIGIPSNASQQAALHRSLFPDCWINGALVKQNESISLNLGGYPRCIQCTCLNGIEKCFSSWKKIPTPISLNNKRFIGFTQRFCSNPSNIKCQRDTYSWSHNGCNYTCNNSKLEYHIVKKPWCQKLTRSKYCADCGNKTDFFTKYGSMLTLCKRQEEVIKKEQICDGVIDCEDMTDEENCTHYFCQRNETEIVDTVTVWPRTRVNDSVEIQCSLISKWWTGTLRRTCRMQHGEQAYFSELDYCSCMDSRNFHLELNITSHDNMSMIDERILKISKKLLLYARTAVRASQYMIMANFLRDIAKNSKDRWAILEMVDVISELQPPCGGKRRPRSRIQKFPSGRIPILSAQIASYKDVLINKEKLLEMITRKYGITASRKSETSSNLKSLGVLLNETKFEANISSEANFTKQNWKNSRSDQQIHLDANETGTINQEQILKRFREVKAQLMHIDIATKIEIGLGSFSVLSCIVCLIMYKVLRVESSTKCFLHKNLFIAWILSYGLQMVGNSFESKFQKKKDFCTAYLIMNHYSILAFFTWMFLEGYNLWMVLIVIFNTKSKRHYLFSLVGWGLPLCLSAIEIGIFFDTFKNNKSCVGLEKKDWLFKAPMGLLLALNGIVFTAVGFVILKKIRRSANLTSSRSKSMATGKAFLVLLPICGITYLLGFGISNTVVMYVYVIVNSLMGLLLSIFHFFLDTSVQSSFAAYQKRKANLRRFQSESQFTNLQRIQSKN